MPAYDVAMQLMPIKIAYQTKLQSLNQSLVNGWLITSQVVTEFSCYEIKI